MSLHNSSRPSMLPVFGNAFLYALVMLHVLCNMCCVTYINR